MYFKGLLNVYNLNTAELIQLFVLAYSGSIILYRGNVDCGKEQEYLHVDVWNYMVDETPKEKLRKVTKVKDPKGLKQFVFDLANNKSSNNAFHSDMNSNQKLIGSVEIPLCEIPAAGLDQWWILEKAEAKVSIFLLGRIFIKCTFHIYTSL